MMCGEAAGQKVEFRVFERETLGGSLDRLDVAEALHARRRRDRRQHLARQIRRYDPARVARKDIRDVAPARPEIERERWPQLARDRLDRVEVRALSVNLAFDIGSRARAELRLDDFLMRFDHESAPLAFTEHTVRI